MSDGRRTRGVLRVQVVALGCGIYIASPYRRAQSGLVFLVEGSGIGFRDVGGAIAIRFGLFADRVELGFTVRVVGRGMVRAIEFIIVDSMSITASNKINLAVGGGRGGTELVVHVATQLNVVARKFTDLERRSSG